MINCQKINFKEHIDVRGNLVALENSKDIYFPIKRIYYIYNVKDGEERGFHSHKDLEQVLISLGGSVKIRVKTNTEEEIYELNNPSEGLYIGPMVWREMFDFTPNTTLLVIASHEYDDNDYIRNYNEYIKLASEYFKNINDINKYMVGQNIYLKKVEESDAKFLSILRCDKVLTKYLSPVNGSIEDQIKWIRNYKMREYSKKEYYFKVINKSHEDQGFARLYHIDYEKKEATFGSFLMKRDHDKNAAIESMILINNLAFNYLGIQRIILDVRCKNEHAKKFYQRFGYQKYAEDDLNEYYELKKDDFKKLYDEKYKYLVEGELYES